MNEANGNNNNYNGPWLLGIFIVTCFSAWMGGAYSYIYGYSRMSERRIIDRLYAIEDLCKK